MIRKLSSGKYRLYSRKSQSEDRQAPQSRHFRLARRGREARARGAVFQAALTLPFDTLRRRSLINADAEAADSSPEPEFSQRIRASLPKIAR